MPTHKHGDASPEYIEPCSLLFHQHTASTAKRFTWVSHMLATEARVFLLHSSSSSSSSSSCDNDIARIIALLQIEKMKNIEMRESVRKFMIVW